MSTWAQRAKAHFQQERQNSTTETTESPCIFTEERPKHTTETTETPLSMVLTVQSGRFREKHDFQSQGESAENDPSPTPIKAQAMPMADCASGEVIDIGTVRPPGLSAKLLAASLALDAQIHAAGALPGGPDRHCRPNSTAMNSAEIGTFTARLARFTDKGVSHGDAERLADKLVMRDREQDDRRLCLECTHLGGYGASSWRCDNWQRAGVAIRARDAQLPVDLVQQLQRCDGLTNAFNPTHTARTHP